MSDISVVIPIGRNPIYRQWLKECIDSVLEQTQLPTEIIIIDDQAGLDNILQDYIKYELYKDGLKGSLATTLYRDGSGLGYPDIVYYKTAWRVGVADAFNFGVGLASNNLVYMLGSDDRLFPRCLQECVKAYDMQQIEGWYNVTVLTEAGNKIRQFNNAAMVTKKLWYWLGGFPPAAGVAACDALALSILMVHAPERMIVVCAGEPLYWAREHEYQDTRKNMAYYSGHNVVEQIRNLETARFVPLDKS